MGFFTVCSNVFPRSTWCTSPSSFTDRQVLTNENARAGSCSAFCSNVAHSGFLVSFNALNFGFSPIGGLVKRRARCSKACCGSGTPALAARPTTCTGPMAMGEHSTLATVGSRSPSSLANFRTLVSSLAVVMACTCYFDHRWFCRISAEPAVSWSACSPITCRCCFVDVRTRMVSTRRFCTSTPPNPAGFPGRNAARSCRRALNRP